MAKVKKLTATGDVENNVPIKIYEIITGGSSAGANVKVQDSTTELIRIFHAANTSYQFKFYEKPIICKTECTLTISGTMEATIIYDEWAL